MQQQHPQHQPKNPHSDDSRRNPAGGNPDKDPKPNPNEDKPQPDKPRRDDDPRNPTRQRQAFKSY